MMDGDGGYCWIWSGLLMVRFSFVEHELLYIYIYIDVYYINQIGFAT